MKWLIAIAVVVAACGKDKDKDTSAGDKIDLDEIQAEASVEFARKELPNLEAKLASDDPGAASSSCAVIKPDLAAIAKADPKLAKTIAQRCGRDLAIRQLAVFVEKAEAARKADPEGKFVPECSGLDIYLKPVKAAAVESDPEVAKLVERHAAACPKR